MLKDFIILDYKDIVTTEFIINFFLRRQVSMSQGGIVTLKVYDYIVITVFLYFMIIIITT